MSYSPVTKKVAPLKENVRLKLERRKIVKTAREERRLARRASELEMGTKGDCNGKATI